MIEKYYSYILNMLLFFIGVNFFDKSNYISILLFLIVITYKFFFKEKIKINIELILIFMFSQVYSYIYYNYFGIDMYILSYVAILLPVFYFIGLNINAKSYDKMLISFSIGLSLFGALNLFETITSDRNSGDFLINFWTKNFSTSTIQGSLFTSIMSLIFYNIFYLKEILIKTIVFILILFSFVNIFYTSGRALILISVAIFILNILLFIIYNKKNIKILKKFLLLLSSVLLIFNCVLYFDLFNLYTIISESYLYDRIIYFFNNSDPRIEMYNFILTNWDLYLHGGVTLSDSPLAYAHNLWLDVYIKVGIIPFCLLILYSITSFMTLIKLNLNKYIPHETKIIITSIYFGLNINFFIEPAIESMPMLVCLLVFINGLTYNLIKVNCGVN